MFLASKGISALTCLNSRFVNPTWSIHDVCAFPFCSVFSALSAILLLGNVTYTLSDDTRALEVGPADVLSTLSDLLKVRSRSAWSRFPFHCGYSTNHLCTYSIMVVCHMEGCWYSCSWLMLTFSSVLYLGQGGPSGKDFEQKRNSGCQHYRGVTAHSAGGTPEVI